MSSDRLREVRWEAFWETFDRNEYANVKEMVRAGWNAALTEQPDATAPADLTSSVCNYPFVAAGSEELGIAPAIIDRCELPRGHAGQHKNGNASWGHPTRELPPAAPPAQVSEEQFTRELWKDLIDWGTYASFEAGAKRFYAKWLRSPASTSGKALPKPENMKWLLDAANQVISELSKQGHLDSDTFRWLCNAVGQVERDLKRSAILEGKG